MSEELIILVDDREKCPLEFGDTPTERVRLPVGDYSARGCTDLVAIERKRIDELATCCGRDRERFLEQVDRLRAYPVRALAIEGLLGEINAKLYRSNIRPASVLGTLTKFLVDWHIPVLFCGDRYDTARMVFAVLRRAHRQRLDLTDSKEVA